MSLQIIKSIDGKAEYVLLPIGVYKALRGEIEAKLSKKHSSAEYASFNPADYVDNPVALARIQARLTQEELAHRMKVTQAYISKVESQDKVSAKVMLKVKAALVKKS